MLQATFRPVKPYSNKINNKERNMNKMSKLEAPHSSLKGDYSFLCISLPRTR